VPVIPVLPIPANVANLSLLLVIPIVSDMTALAGIRDVAVLPVDNEDCANGFTG